MTPEHVAHLRARVRTLRGVEMDRDAWRQAALMLEAVLSEIDPAKAAGVRKMFDCLEWGEEER